MFMRMSLVDKEWCVFESPHCKLMVSVSMMKKIMDDSGFTEGVGFNFPISVTSGSEQPYVSISPGHDGVRRLIVGAAWLINNGFTLTLEPA